MERSPKPPPLLATLTVAITLLGGCALSGRDDSAAEPDPDLVARNLVHTLAQLVELNPMQTTVQVSAPATPFGERVLARLEDAGYGVQRVINDQGAHYVRYSRDRSSSESGERLRYRVAIGPIAVERDFDVVDGQTVPRSVQVVEGTSEQPLRVNDELFDADAVDGLSVAVIDAPVLIDYTRGAPPASDVVLAPRSSPDPAAATPDVFGRIVRQNVFERQGSNYAAIFADYEDVRQDALIFPNDSMYLGRANKAIIAEYLGELDPATDVLSVIGCSHGRTALPNGNELLAIGRANRFKEALVYAGLEHDQVLEESCWAGEYHARFPKRGVVLTLKRRQEG